MRRNENGKTKRKGTRNREGELTATRGSGYRLRRTDVGYNAGPGMSVMRVMALVARFIVERAGEPGKQK